MELIKKNVYGRPTHPNIAIQGHYGEVRRLYYRKGDKFIPLELFYHEETKTLIEPPEAE